MALSYLKGLEPNFIVNASRAEMKETEKGATLHEIAMSRSAE
jgi:hypothetical protein